MARPGKHDSVMLDFSTGKRNLGKVKNERAEWARLIKRLSTPTRTAELFRDYLKLSQNDQAPLKQVNGYFIGAHCDGGKRARDTIKRRNIITFDIDDAPPGIIDELRFGLTGISKFEFFTHSTRKHCADKPRLRIVFPLSAYVTADQYNAAARLLAFKLDSTMDLVDDVSFRLAQLMYWPSCSRDSDWFCMRNEGDLVDPMQLLDDFGDWQDDTKLPYSAKQGHVRKAAKKAQVPTEKKGIIGAFCRAYSVEDAIATFLPDVYLPGDPHSGKPRYTYAKGSASNGAVVEDGGLFLYSHHGTDPCGDRLVNAWDLVRIHRFRHLDEQPEDDESVPPAKRESYAAMIKLAEDDDGTRGELVQARYDLESMFGDEDTVAGGDQVDPALADPLGFDDEESTTPDLDEDIEALLGFNDSGTVATRSNAYVAPEDWFKRLDFTQNGELKSTLPNITAILESDPRTRGAIAFNEFTHRMVLRRSIFPGIDLVPSCIVPKYAVDGIPWEDRFEVTLRFILEWPAGKKKKGFGLSVSRLNLADAVAGVAHRNPFHPVREYFDSLVWDGKPRVDRLLVEYLGCPDDEYHREVSRRVFLGAVARTYRPGHKFDFALILEGEQGIRKSTFVRVLARDRWYGELTDDVGNQNRMVEKMAGRLIMEIGELASLTRSEVGDIKAFISRTEDTCRLAFARNVATYLRQCIFIGTTNLGEYLKDETGGRRFWPVRIYVAEIDTERLDREMDQVWAEAVHLHRVARVGLHERAEINLDFSDPRARATAAALQEEVRIKTDVDSYAGMIQAWLEQPVKLSQLFQEADRAFDLDDDPMVLRTVICARQIYDALLSSEGVPFEKATWKIGQAMRSLKKWDKGGTLAEGKHDFGGTIGRQRAFKRKKTATKDLHRGYVVPKVTPDDLI